MTSAQRPIVSRPAPDDATGRENLLLLLQLRWIAVLGQVMTIAVVSLAFRVSLPLQAMAAILLILVGMNLVGHARLRAVKPVAKAELFGALLTDMAALSAQLFLSGGAANPFIFLYLLQITLGAVLLDAWSVWAFAALASAAFAALTRFNRPLDLPAALADRRFQLHIEGMLVCFILDAALLLTFVGRITRNLRVRDAHLADLKQHAAEEDHIVRMGLLASGAAHELGTPLATLSVILNDWRRTPSLNADPQLRHEIEEMEGELKRCKTIVSGILMSAGEARGEELVLAGVGEFLDDVVENWRRSRSGVALTFQRTLTADPLIIADVALRQVLVNVLDNAAEASPQGLGLRAHDEDGVLILQVSDHGPGFAPDILDTLGKPYRSTKDRQGAGLGLFLVVNVVRKLGGSVTARNAPNAGAVVTLRIPLASLSAERIAATQDALL